MIILLIPAYAPELVDYQSWDKNLQQYYDKLRELIGLYETDDDRTIFFAKNNASSPALQSQLLMNNIKQHRFLVLILKYIQKGLLRGQIYQMP